MSSRTRPQISSEDLAERTMRSFSFPELDLLDIVGKCARLDRETPRSQDSSCAWTRDLQLPVDVRDLELWQGKAGRDLECLLSLATGDRWSLEFTENVKPEGTQCPLPLDLNISAAFSVSDGLDSLAGAALWTASHPKSQAAAITASKQQSVRTAQIYQRFPRITLIPFKLRIDAGMSKEDTYRTRALTFFVPAILAAAKLNVGTLAVLESGQGALGSWLITLGREYPYVSLTPFFLQKLSDFVREHLSLDVSVGHPYLWQTKAQVIKGAVSSGAVSGEAIRMTRSCSRFGRKRTSEGGAKMPCGICGGCLHRRCALVNAGFLEEEEEQTYVYQHLRAANLENMMTRGCNALKIDHTYLESSVADMRLLAQAGARSGSSSNRLLVRRLARSLGQSEGECRDQLSHLLQAHLQEWNNFLEWTGPRSWIRQHGSIR